MNYFVVLIGAFLIKNGEAMFFGKKTTATTPPTTTTTTTNVTLAANAPPEDNLDPIKYELGTILGVAFGVVFGIALVGFAGYLYIKQKRQRDQEYTRRTKIKMMSSRNAGVYVDTTTQEKLFQDDNFTFTGPDYRALQTFKTSYDDDSDEELWTSKMRG